MSEKPAAYLPPMPLADGSISMNPRELVALEWIARYGTPEDREKHRFEFASALSTLLYLTSTSPTTEAAQRKLGLIRRAVRESEARRAAQEKMHGEAADA